MERVHCTCVIWKVRLEGVIKRGVAKVCSIDMPPKKKQKRNHTSSAVDRQGVKRESVGANAGSSSRLTADPLTRNDIPTIVQEVARQLHSGGPEDQASLVPGMFFWLLF